MSESSAPQRLREKPPTGGVLPAYRYLVRGLLIFIAAFAISMVFNVVFLFMLQNRSGQKPWVATLSPEGDLRSMMVSEFDTTPDLVFQYLSYVVPRLYLVDTDKQPGLLDLASLVDERILRKEKAAFDKQVAYTNANKVVMQAAPTRLLIGTQTQRCFAISKKYARVYCMVEGRFTMTSKERNYSDPIRWDVELEIVTPTKNNRWGLRLVQIRERPIDFAPIEIPQIYFE